jgi:hypothetical protein
MFGGNHAIMTVFDVEPTHFWSMGNSCWTVSLYHMVIIICFFLSILLYFSSTGVIIPNKLHHSLLCYLENMIRIVSSVVLLCSCLQLNICRLTFLDPQWMLWSLRNHIAINYFSSGCLWYIQVCYVTSPLRSPGCSFDLFLVWENGSSK